MNKGYGGEQKEMRNSKVDNDTYLRSYTHPHKLKVGDVQFMQYRPEDSGPIYLSEEEKINTNLIVRQNTKRPKNMHVPN